MQAQPKPLDVVPQEHTDFIFDATAGRALLAAVVIVTLALVLAVTLYRRRR